MMPLIPVLKGIGAERTTDYYQSLHESSSAAVSIRQHKRKRQVAITLFVPNNERGKCHSDKS